MATRYAAGPYRVEHDQSKNLAPYHDLIRRLADHKKAAEFRMSAAARVRFPLQLTQLIQVDSRTSPAVQIADILVGAVIEAGNTLAGVRSAGLDPRAVLSLYAEDQLIHLLPSGIGNDRHVHDKSSAKWRIAAPSPSHIKFLKLSFFGSI
ncbi:hypothetical protein [Sphingobium sp. TKS]|uniref:hypothetical protein n=1 Tax=Sphingobium sp. TKS TaxID=1315974 RepID=UPI00077001AD|nr:hypothetical protein [Sphingobium sp. TKS]AMK26124.1 hypothetical protein K426_26125 [Sphingobium sp. TKS]